MRKLIISTILLTLAAGLSSCGGGEREDAKAAYKRLSQAVIEGDFDALIDMMTPDDRELCLAHGREELRRTQEDPNDETRAKWAAHYGAPLEELLEKSPRELVCIALQRHLGYSYTPDYFRTAHADGVEPLLGETVRVHVIEQVGKRRRAYYEFTWIEGAWRWVFPGRAALDPGLLKGNKR